MTKVKQVKICERRYNKYNEPKRKQIQLSFKTNL